MHIYQKAILDIYQNNPEQKFTLRQLGARVENREEKSISPEKVKHHLSQLLKKGLLRVDPLTQNYIPVQLGYESKTNLISIPILGNANCGVASMIAEEAFEGMLKVSSSVIRYKPTLISIKAVGNSMNKASIDGDLIEDGDYLIVDCDYRNPINMDIVLSNIEGHANIKRFIKKNNLIYLVSESSQELPPIVIHQEDINNYSVSGKVIKVIKNPQISDIT